MVLSLPMAENLDTILMEIDMEPELWFLKKTMTVMETLWMSPENIMSLMKMVMLNFPFQLSPEKELNKQVALILQKFSGESAGSLSSSAGDSLFPTSEDN